MRTIKRFDEFDEFSERTFRSSLFNCSLVSHENLLIEVVSGRFTSKTEGRFFKSTSESCSKYTAENMKRRETEVYNICLKYGLIYRCVENIIKIEQSTYSNTTWKTIERVLVITVTSNSLPKIIDDEKKIIDDEKREQNNQRKKVTIQSLPPKHKACRKQQGKQP